MKTDLLKFNSICCQEWPHVTGNEPHILPIYNTSAFVFDDIQQGINIFEGKEKGFSYSRYDNPTLATTAEKLAALESIDLDDKAHCVLCGSGMGAISSLLYAVLEQGDTILTQGDLYGGTTELIQNHLNKFGIKFIVVDFNDLAAVKEILEKKTVKLIYIETPSNPLLSVVDLKEVASLAKQHNIVTAIDNTFASCYLQRPLNYGIDYVIYSTTKYLNGMGNALGGAIITREEENYNKVWNVLKLNGTYCSPTDAWYLYNGLKTFPIRMDRHCANALALAQFLEGHKFINKVNYPGLKSHPGHETAKNQMAAFGGMLSFEIDGTLAQVLEFMNSLKLATLAPTLGNVDTILLHPATSSHLKVDKAQREKVGITDSLVRVSVGIEDIEDLIHDFEQALNKVEGVTPNRP